MSTHLTCFGVIRTQLCSNYTTHHPESAIIESLWFPMWLPEQQQGVTTKLWTTKKNKKSGETEEWTVVTGNHFHVLELLSCTTSNYHVNCILLLYYYVYCFFQTFSTDFLLRRYLGIVAPMWSCNHIKKVNLLLLSCRTMWQGQPTQPGRESGPCISSVRGWKESWERYVLFNVVLFLLCKYLIHTISLVFIHVMHQDLTFTVIYLSLTGE